MIENTAAPGLENVRALVVDDDELVRKLACTILSKSGFLVEAAADGREGLQLLLLRDFDVAVVDLKMSGMDGFAFVREALTICPWLGVIIVTGYAHEETEKQARKLGVKHVLRKPFDVGEFRRIVLEQAVEKRQKLKSPANLSLQRIQSTLNLFEQLGRAATESETLLDALHGLSAGLGFLDARAVAILSLEEDPTLMLFPRSGITKPFADAFAAAVRQRYTAFSGRDLPGDLQVEIDGTIAANGLGAADFVSCFSVPIIAAGEIRGLLSLAAPAASAYKETDMLFLYHAANLLSTVLLTFRRIRQLAVRDPLTGLYNQRGLSEQLDSIWQLGRRYHYRVSIAMLDIDRFKTVNDTYGHPVGDMVLKEMTKLVRNTVRASDIVGRYGGDEIVIVFPDATQDDLRAFSARLLHTMHTHVFCADTHAIRLTTSIGIASSHGQDWMLISSDNVLSQADQALYAAKEAGRDRCYMWIPSLSHAEPLAAATAQPPAHSAEAPPAGNNRGRIMVVDDEQPILDILSRMLAAEGFTVTTHLTAADAIREVELAADRYDVILADLTLKKGESGFDLLKTVRTIDETLITTVMTGFATLDNAVGSLRQGAYDFIGKPIDAKHLVAMLDRAVEYRRLLIDNRRYRVRLEDLVREKSRELALALDQEKQSYNFTLEAMVSMLDAREQATALHSLNVQEMALVVGKELGMSETLLRELGHGALLHDIGKIAISDAILLKRGPLTEAEWEVMKTHPRIGFDLLGSSSFLKGAAEIVLSHQECYDGTGYPRGLKGEEITQGARIFSVVDAYDAMRSDRPYRKAMTREAAVAELRRASGTQFDPVVVDTVLRCLPKLEKMRAIDRSMRSRSVVEILGGMKSRGHDTD